MAAPVDAAACAVRDVPFVLFGVGGVGSELLRSISRSRSFHAERYGVRLQCVGVCDSSGAVQPAAGASEVDDASLAALVAHKASGEPLARLPGATPRSQGGDGDASAFLLGVAQRLAKGALVVDCTASDATLPALLHAASEPAGLKVVLANKKPVAGSGAAFAAFRQAHARVRFESTVGAGLPAVASVQRVVASGDQVTRVCGSLSGTLGYVMAQLQAPRSDGGSAPTFSEVVLAAKALGYTEPDPRDDLGGVDVARKALILARVLGLELELADVAVEPLYDVETMGALSVDAFVAALPQLDAKMQARCAAAALQGQVLRYAATVDVGAGTCAVGLVAVAAASPLGTLTGSDNLVEVFSSGVYPSSPLVVRGAGAGAASTAAGVLADLLELAFVAV